MKEARERHVRQTFERDLRDTEKRYRRLFLGHPHPTWVYDIASSRILMVNDAAIARYGFSREEFLEMTLNDFLPWGGSGSDEHIEKHRTKTGELIDVVVAYTDIELDDRAARIVVATLIA